MAFLFARNSRKQAHYSTDFSSHAARQGMACLNAACNPAEERKRYDKASLSEYKTLYGGGDVKFTMSTAAVVGYLHQGGTSGFSSASAKILCATSLTTNPINQKETLMAGVPTLEDIQAAQSDSDFPPQTLSRMQGAFLQAMDTLYKPVGVPVASKDYHTNDHAAFNRTETTLTVKGTVTLPNTSGKRLSPGDVVQFVHPCPPGWRVPGRPEVVTPASDTNRVNYQMALVRDLSGATELFEYDLASDSPEHCPDGVASLSSGIAGLVARAVVRLVGAGVLKIKSDFQGYAGRTTSCFSPPAMKAKFDQPCTAECGAFVEGMLGEDGLLRKPLIKSMFGAQTAFSPHDNFAGMRERAAFEKHAGNALQNLVRGCTQARNRPGLRATVLKGGEATEHVNVDLGV